MTISYHKVNDTVDSVVALFPDETEPIQVADENHPNWEAILNGLRNQDPATYALFDVWGGIKAKFRSLSERVDWDGENIRFDGDVVHDAIAGQIQRFLEADLPDWAPLVKFWENVAQNPSEHSKESLYRWLRDGDFTITDTGNIVAYKGVQVRTSKYGATLDENKFESIHAGPAIVDGKAVDGHVPNNPGSVITMPRSDVTANPAVGCHVGLHVGTWSYANSFGPVVMEVHVNPRDVVSVPTDCGSQKMRVCRYTVIEVIGAKYDDALVATEDYNSLEEYDDSEPDWEPDVSYDASRY